MPVHEPLSPEDERLLPLVVAIADGSPVAWPSVRTPLVEQLRHLERLVRGHHAVRSSASSTTPSRETLLTEARRRNAGGPDTLRVQWGSLVVFEKIGRGSFGDVYRAWDPRLDREVALKLIPEDMSADATSPVIEEGGLLARVRHPNVMTVYGADRCDGRTGIWTEYIRGETLAAEVTRRGPLAADEAVRIGVDVCGDEGPETIIERDEMEKAAAALEALFALQPDHYAVRNNLRTVYRLLGRDRDIAWMNQRLADARPWSVTENLEVARQLWREGNIEGARRYSARAESALSSVSWAGDVDAAASVRLFAACIAWAQDDPNATIQALDQVAASAGTLPPPERRQLSVRLAPMYAAVSRLQDAERALDAAQPADRNDAASVMTIAIARAALYEDWADLTRLRDFASTRWREPLPPTAPALSARRAPFLIDVGLLDDAERDLEWFRRRTAEKAEWAPTVPRRQFQPFEASTRAAISLKRGRAADAVAVLRQQMPVLRDAPPWVFGPGGWHTQYAAAKLAEGLEAVGKLPEAIAVLEEAMRDRVALTIGNTPHRWLRANAELARLYRLSGQEARAREIETRLSKLLTLADAGHPLALELKSRR